MLWLHHFVNAKRKFDDVFCFGLFVGVCGLLDTAFVALDRA